jgi:hypothetical protein
LAVTALFSALVLKINIFYSRGRQNKKAQSVLKNLVLLHKISPVVYLDAFFAAAFFGFAGLLLPKELLKRFPLAVFLSPLPIMQF